MRLLWQKMRTLRRSFRAKRRRPLHLNNQRPKPNRPKRNLPQRNPHFPRRITQRKHLPHYLNKQEERQLCHQKEC